MRNSNRSRAFTLLEIVLAMAMTAMLSLTLYTALRVCIVANRSAAGELAEIRDADGALDQLASDLSQALPPTGTLAGPFTGTSSNGADALEFYRIDTISTSNQALPMPGVVRVNWLLQGQPNDLTLRRVATRSLVASTEPPAQDDAQCQRVRTLTLRYYDGSAWRSDWDSTAENDSLPTAIEITLEINRSVASQSQATRRLTRIVRVACAPAVSQSSSGATP